MNRSLFRGPLPALALVLSLHAPPSPAWDDLGHSAVGAIAEADLLLDPDDRGRRFASALMGSEPMPLSAEWPDHVRPADVFKQKFWKFHFIEVSPEEWKADPKLTKLGATDNALEILEKAPELLLDRSLDLEQRRILFRYLVHVVGDVHQPLHVGNGRDRGANLCFVKVEEPESGHYGRHDLHHFWDEMLLRDLNYQKDKDGNWKLKSDYFFYPDLIQVMKANHEQVQPKDGAVELPVREWLKESRGLHGEVYYGGDLAEPRERKYCYYVADDGKTVVKRNFREDQVPEISMEDPFRVRGREIVQQRVVLGGQRLARLIKSIAARADAADLNAVPRDTTVEGLFKKMRPNK